MLLQAPVRLVSCVLRTGAVACRAGDTAYRQPLAAHVGVQTLCMLLVCCMQYMYMYAKLMQGCFAPSHRRTIRTILMRWKQQLLLPGVLAACATGLAKAARPSTWSPCEVGHTGSRWSSVSHLLAEQHDTTIFTFCIDHRIN